MRSRGLLLLACCLALSGCAGGPLARLAEYRHQREVERKIADDPFPTAAEAGLAATDPSTQKS